MQQNKQLPYKLGSMCSHGSSKSSTAFIDIACSDLRDTYHRIYQVGKICNKCSILIMNSVKSSQTCPCCSDSLQYLVHQSKICNHSNAEIDEVTIKCMNNKNQQHQIPFGQKICQLCSNKIKSACLYTTSCIVCNDKQNQLFDNIEKIITKPSYYYFNHIIKQMQKLRLQQKYIKQQIQYYCLAKQRPNIQSKFANDSKQFGENKQQDHKSKRYHLYPKCPKHRKQFISLCNGCLVSILNLATCPYGCPYDQKQSKTIKTTPAFTSQTGFICLYPKQHNNYQYLDYFHFKFTENQNKFEKWEGSLKKIKYQANHDLSHKFPLYSSATQIAPLTYFYCGGVIGQNIKKMKTTNSAFLIHISQNHKSFSIQDLPPMKQPRSSHSTVYFENNVYVIGGFNRQTLTFVTTCQKYSLTQKKWSAISSMKIKRSKPTVFQYKGSIYSLGGIFINSQNDQDTPCQRYDISKNQWKMLKYQGYDIPFISASASLTKCWGAPKTSNLFVIGGSNYQSSTYFVQELIFNGDKFKMNPSGIEQRLTHNRSEPALSFMKADTNNQGIVVVFGGLEQHESALNLDALRLKYKNNEVTPYFVYDNVSVGSYRLLLRQNSISAYSYMMNKLIKQGLLTQDKLNQEEPLKSQSVLHLIQKMWYGIGKCIVGFNGI